MRTLWKNCRIILTDRVTEGYLTVEDGVITGLFETQPDGLFDRVIDGEGRYLSPGLIDLHVHGGNGCDFMDGTPEAIREIGRYHASHGVTSMLATSLAGKEEETLQMLAVYHETAPTVRDIHFLGVHLEGPYFSQGQRGAQDPRYILDPDPAQYTRLLTSDVRRMSLAPELPGAMELGRYLQERGILASVAHTEADYDKVAEAAENGFTMLTHLYSGMLGVHRKGPFRYGGAVEAGLLLDGMTAEVIADGCHLPPCLLRLIYKCKGRYGMTLTSDAMRGAGLPEGSKTRLGSLTAGQEVDICQGVAMMPDRTAFAGSIASGDRLIRTMLSAVGLPIWEAVGMMSENPARLLGVFDRKGSIAPGKDADLILFDGDVNIKKVMVAGSLPEEL